MINGSPPVIGKQVFDIMQGYGRIESVEPDMAFIVMYPGRKQQRYSAGGYVGKIRRVYWENPIVVEPTADNVGWQTFVNITRQLYDLMMQVRGVR